MLFVATLVAALAGSAGVQAGEEVFLGRRFEVQLLQNLAPTNDTVQVSSIVEQGDGVAWQTMSWAEEAPRTSKALSDGVLTVTISKSRPAESIQPTEKQAAPLVTKAPVEAVQKQQSVVQSQDTVEEPEKTMQPWEIGDYLAMGMCFSVSALVFLAAGAL